MVVSGRVQGVGFRWYCRGEALSLGVGGYVRNMPDGRVEAVFEGDPSAVRSLLEWCRTGPSSARVDRIEVEDEAPTGTTRFVIAHD